MFKQGNYIMKVIYFHNEKEWLVYDCKKGKEYHTHIPYKLNRAARMIVIRASNGNIPNDYPMWMVESINRIWYGKDYADRMDLCNENLYTNNSEVRFPRKKKKGNKGYVNNSKR